MTRKQTNSRAKGARGERDWAAFLTANGFPATRNARNGLSADDLIIPCLPSVHLEIKWVEGMDVGTELLARALEQAEANAGGRFPFVAWRWSRGRRRLTWRDDITKLPVTIGGDRDIVIALAPLRVECPTNDTPTQG